MNGRPRLMTVRWTRWLVAVLACAAMIGLHAYSGDFPREQVTRVALGKPGRLYDATVTVNSSTVGQVLYSDQVFVGRTPVIFLSVNVTIVADGRHKQVDWKVGGVSNGRTFAALDPLFTPAPGFRITQDVVFELSPDDLAGFTVTFLSRAPIYAYDPQLEIDLGLTASGAAELVEKNRYAVVRSTRGRAEVIR